MVMLEVLWHRRETKRLKEKTNLNLQYREKPVYSTQFLMCKKGGAAMKATLFSLLHFRAERFPWPKVTLKK